jgi:hypothetical protein
VRQKEQQVARQRERRIEAERRLRGVETENRELQEIINRLVLAKLA